MPRPKPFFWQPEQIKSKKPRTPIKALGKILDCATCGLDRGCQSPKMLGHGKNELGIVILAEAPGEHEDKQGIQFVGNSGQLLRERLKKQGILMDRDCLKLSVIRCRPPGNRSPSPTEIACCRESVSQQIREADPAVIIALGGTAISEALCDAPPKVNLSPTTMHGRAIPSNYWGCWVVPCYHPSYFLHKKTEDQVWLIDNAIKTALACLSTPYTDQRLDEDEFILMEDFKQVTRYLDDLIRYEPDRLIALDYEATCLSPWKDNARFLTVGFATSSDTGVCIPLEHPQAKWSAQELDLIYSRLRSVLQSPNPKVIQNWQFEEIWSKVKLGVGITNVICDTMVREHIIDNREAVTSQGFQTYVRYGAKYKSEVDVKNLADAHLDAVARYNVLDCRYLFKWKHDQDKQMCGKLSEAYSFFHEAIPVMAKMSIRGMRIDLDKLASLEKEVRAGIDEIEQTRTTIECLSDFRAKEGHTWNSASPKDCQALFFDQLKLTPLKKTKTGYSTDRETIESLMTQVEQGSDIYNLLDGLITESKLSKMLGTYLVGLREQVTSDSKIHPNFHLHKVVTYRSSSSDPNFQNFPIRDPLSARVRRAMVPQNDFFVEIDFAGNEVRWIAIYSKDKKLIDFIMDPSKDIHRYWAAVAYKQPEPDVTKDQRFNGKNGLVFPLFYGSWYKPVASALGISDKWAEQVEKDFFMQHGEARKWQETQQEFYKTHGYIETLLGFRFSWTRRGPLKRNECYNSPIQGTAFHRLVRSLIDLDSDIEQKQLKSFLVGQIHDSIVLDVTADELEQVIDMADHHMTKKIWDFEGDVRMGIEPKVGVNFLDMEKV